MLDLDGDDFDVVNEYVAGFVVGVGDLEEYGEGGIVVELFPDTAEIDKLYENDSKGRIDIDFVPVAAWVEFLDGFCFDLAGGGYRESYHVDKDFEVVFVVHLKVEY